MNKLQYDVCHECTRLRQLSYIQRIRRFTILPQKVKVVFVSYGSRELGGNRRGVFGGDPKVNVEALKEAGVNSVFYVSPDTAHEWLSWCRSLHEFAPLLFKD